MLIRSTTKYAVRTPVARLSLERLSISLLCVVGLVACGGPPPTPSEATAVTTPSIVSQQPDVSLVPSDQPSQTPFAGATVDACGLLPTALLSKVFGGEAAFPKPMPSGGWTAGQCAWNGQSAGFFLKVGTAASLTDFGDPAAPDAEAKLTAFKKSMSTTGSPKEVQGIGDGAVLTASAIAAHKDGTYIEITNLGLTDEQLIEVAKLAIANL